MQSDDSFLHEAFSRWVISFLVLFLSVFGELIHKGWVLPGVVHRNFLYSCFFDIRNRDLYLPDIARCNESARWFLLKYLLYFLGNFWQWCFEQWHWKVQYLNLLLIGSHVPAHRLRSEPSSSNWIILLFEHMPDFVVLWYNAVSPLPVVSQIW